MEKTAALAAYVRFMKQAEEEESEGESPEDDRRLSFGGHVGRGAAIGAGVGGTGLAAFLGHAGLNLKPHGVNSAGRNLRMAAVLAAMGELAGGGLGAGAGALGGAGVSGIRNLMNDEEAEESSPTGMGAGIGALGGGLAGGLGLGALGAHEASKPQRGGGWSPRTPAQNRARIRSGGTGGLLLGGLLGAGLGTGIGAGAGKIKELLSRGREEE